MEKIPVIILTGPTAVGKTKLSVELAKELNAHIISSDSMQIYKHMDIGTAKVTKEEMDGIKHYMIDEVMPDEEFSVSKFQKKTMEYIRKIHNEGKIPILTGGTGLYLNSIIYDMDFSKTKGDNTLRLKLQNEYEEHGKDYLYDKLLKLDKESAQNIHKNNVKRVIRALEIALNGEKKGDFSKDLKLNSEIEPILIILNRNREVLYQRINKRVDIMIEQGLLDEVKTLVNMGYNKNMVSMKAIGYKEIMEYLDDEITYEDAIDKIKRESRRYAKRQITWFKRYNDACFIDIDDIDFDELKNNIIKEIKAYYS
ncbi:MAG: tRNA (adenosine(37)-N6)-dimethylallyltransferase MiaA [Peptostreptococcaceae bacterium]|jgi:tRNA dimethylallyltransferase|nr:tRNA (adenosine(37)-N6)-dimethylallyltransferase MiaA [Peptostreptococcaceae bacterium]